MLGRRHHDDRALACTKRNWFRDHRNRRNRVRDLECGGQAAALGNARARLVDCTAWIGIHAATSRFLTFSRPISISVKWASTPIEVQRLSHFGDRATRRTSSLCDTCETSGKVERRYAQNQPGQYKGN